ncbi:MAG: hypothetical protein JW725_04545 [Candidatus Babeliaceae bacterium]|nr:hypothetical protein [Candidatus Babeliaceae bacterium]
MKLSLKTLLFYATLISAQLWAQDSMLPKPATDRSEKIGEVKEIGVEWLQYGKKNALLTRFSHHVPQWIGLKKELSFCENERYTPEALLQWEKTYGELNYYLAQQYTTQNISLDSQAFFNKTARRFYLYGKTLLQAGSLIKDDFITGNRKKRTSHILYARRQVIIGLKTIRDTISNQLAPQPTGFWTWLTKRESTAPDCAIKETLAGMFTGLEAMYEKFLKDLDRALATPSCKSNAKL